MLLPLLIMLPLAGAIPLLFVRDENAKGIKVWSFVVSLAALAWALPLWNYDPNGALYQFVFDKPWVKAFNLRFSLGADGLSVLLLLLTAIITPLALLGAWNYVTKRQKEFYISLLVLEALLFGVFVARDLVLFYLFFEAGLIPMYLIIGIWGGANRLYATIKFVLYTAFGSLLMLAAIFYIAHITGGKTFDITGLSKELAVLRASGGLSSATALWLFLAFALAFAVKTPLFPFHTWLPDAHVQAPSPGSVVLAAVLLKMGVYGFLRIAMPLFPQAAAVCIPWLALICLIGIVHGSLMAYVQTDLKKLIAYSSIAHMGVCVLGIASGTKVGVTGGIYLMISHGLTAGGLFILSGMLYERTHTRKIEEYGGLARTMPRLATCFVIISLAAIGLPLTSGFVGEFASLAGAFKHNPWWAVGGVSGVILGAVYMLSAVRRTFFGPVRREVNRSLPDLSARETVILVPLVVLVFVMGVAVKPFQARLAPTVEQYLAQTKTSTKNTGTATPTLAEKNAVVPPAAPTKDTGVSGAVTVSSKRSSL